MSESAKFKAILAVLIAAMIIAGLVFNAASIHGAINQWRYGIQKVDDATSYETRKEVEDTCRAMMASYAADELMWVQYKDSDNAEKQGWAEQAKMRANKTAATYNEYILKNSFVWNGNVPLDVRGSLPYVE